MKMKKKTKWGEKKCQGEINPEKRNSNKKKMGCTEWGKKWNWDTQSEVEKQRRCAERGEKGMCRAR